MSVLTTTPIKAYPGNTTGIIVTSGVNNVFGNWTQIIPASTVTNPAQIAGISAQCYPSGGNFELQIGIGGVGVEVAISNVLYISLGTANCTIQTLMLPIPIDGIPANSRVSVRIRASQTNIAPAIALLYYENLDATVASSGGYNYAPYGVITVPASVTPNATPWANSGWTELIPNLASGSLLLGMAPLGYNSNAGVEYEIDLGTGALGSETVVTTLRSNYPWVNGVQGISNIWLPTGYPLASTSRVSYRVRKSDALTTTFKAFLLYIGPTAPAPVTPIGGMYKIVNGSIKANETYYTSLTTYATTNMAIPQPLIITGFIGDE